MALSDDHIARRGSAMLTALVVQTLSESDPTFKDRFLERLSRAYYDLRDNSDEDRLHEMEMLDWTRENLTGFSKVYGKGEPLLGGE